MSLGGRISCLFYAALYYGVMIFMSFSVVVWMYFGVQEAFDIGGIFLAIVVILTMAAITKGYFSWFAPELKIVERQKVREREFLKSVGMR